MSFSLLRGKDYTEDFYRLHLDEIDSVLDIGCGEGIYAGCLANLKRSVTWHGVEIWEPYTRKFAYVLDEFYDEVFIIDAADFEYKRDYYFIIMGDVLEHMEMPKIKRVLSEAIKHCKYFCISIPLGHDYYTPGGDPNEAMRHITIDWTSESVDALVRDMGGDVLMSREFDCSYLQSPILSYVLLGSGDLNFNKTGR